MSLRTRTTDLLPIVKRIMEKVEIIPLAGCWIFTGAVNDAGYGMVGLGGRKDGVDRAHRVNYRHFVGAIPCGFVVCHRCDVRSCCNPHHLFVGTHGDNHADMMAKKRDSKPPRNLHDRGEYRYNSRLTDEKVIEIRAAFDSGVSVYRLAKVHEYSYGAMYRVCNRKMWKHLP